jgi:prepilin-type processing-associated H-X9-DG protein
MSSIMDLEIGFPQPVYPSMTVIAAYVAFVVLATAMFAGLAIKGWRRPHLADLLIWPMVLIVVMVFCAQGRARHEVLQPYLNGYLLFTWAAVAGAYVMSIVRLTGKGQGAEAASAACAMIAIGIWFGLMSPRFGGAREAARRSQCRNNLKQIGLALHNWHDQHERFPDAVIADSEQPPLSWRVALLPFLEESSLYEQYDRAKPWNDDANLEAARTRVTAYVCPTNRHQQDSRQRYYAAYVLVTGPESVFPNGQGRSFAEITDGSSSTLLAAEACGLNVVWTQPEDADTARQPIGVNLLGSEPAHSPGTLSSYHTGGAHMLLADGSVRFVSERIDRQVLKALTTATGGEPVSDY